MVVVPGQNIATQRALELAIEAGAEDIKETVDEEGQPLLQVRHEVQRHQKLGCKDVAVRARVETFTGKANTLPYLFSFALLISCCLFLILCIVFI